MNILIVALFVTALGGSQSTGQKPQLTNPPPEIAAAKTALSFLGKNISDFGRTIGKEPASINGRIFTWEYPYAYVISYAKPPYNKGSGNAQLSLQVDEKNLVEAISFRWSGDSLTHQPDRHFSLDVLWLYFFSGVKPTRASFDQTELIQKYRTRSSSNRIKAYVAGKLNSGQLFAVCLSLSTPPGEVVKTTNYENRQIEETIHLFPNYSFSSSSFLKYWVGEKAFVTDGLGGPWMLLPVDKREDSWRWKDIPVGDWIK